MRLHGRSPDGSVTPSTQMHRSQPGCSDRAIDLRRRARHDRGRNRPNRLGRPGGTARAAPGRATPSEASRRSPRLPLPGVDTVLGRDPVRTRFRSAERSHWPALRRAVTSASISCYSASRTTPDSTSVCRCILLQTASTSRPERAATDRTIVGFPSRSRKYSPGSPRWLALCQPRPDPPRDRTPEHSG